MSSSDEPPRIPGSLRHLPEWNWRTPDWCRASGIYWESWSLNGEVCIKGLVPPFPGGARLAHCITLLVREFASRCRRSYDGTGVLVFTYSGARTSTTLATVMSLHFDVAFHDAKLIRDHVRHRGAEPGCCRWPAYWLEGDTFEYILPGMPIPFGRVARQKLVVLAEERQMSISLRTTKFADSIRKKWAGGLDVLAGVDGEAVAQILDEKEQGFLVNMIVLVYEQPAGKVRPRPSLEESYRRHESLIAELAPLGEEKRLPLVWHALWRLPSGMTWVDSAGKSWMRYPAVSFMAGVRLLKPGLSPGVADRPCPNDG
jgi:hypothetical protein